MSNPRMRAQTPTALDLDGVTLRVSRPISACQRCRSVKIKCDGRLPACTACEKAGRYEACSSANAQLAQGIERSYVGALEKRVQDLEQRIAQRRRGSDIAQPTASKSDSTLTSATVRPVTNRRGEKQEAADINDLVSDFGFLSVNATARDFHGFTKEISFARLVNSISTLSPLPLSVETPVLQRQPVIPAIQHYLDTIHVLYPFLSEAAVFSSLDAVCDQRGGPMDHWTVRMVLAIDLASRSIRRGDPQYQDAVQHASVALREMESVVRPGTNTAIQALLLLVLYALWDPHHFNSWHLMGAASRLTVDLGLHQGKQSNSQVRPVERELRNRIYESVYALDRSISMTHGRAFSFTDDSTNPLDPAATLKIPSSETPWMRDVGPALELAKLRRIQSDSYQRLFGSGRIENAEAWSFVQEAIQSLDKWFSAVSHQKVRRVFHIDVRYSQILLLTKSDIAPEDAYSMIVEYSRNYIEELLDLINDSVAVSLLNSHDLLRVSYVADKAMTVMKRNDVAAHDTLLEFESAMEYFCYRFEFVEPLSELRTKAGLGV